MLDSYKKTLDSFVGPAEIFICGNTLQVKDYSRFEAMRTSAFISADVETV